MNRDVAFEATRQRQRYVQPQTGAGKLTRKPGVHLEKPLEQLAQRLLVHPDPAVLYIQLQPWLVRIVNLADDQRNPALLGEFEGVVQKVEQDLPQARAIGLDPYVFVDGVGDFKLQIFLLSQWSKDGFNGAQKPREVNRLHREGDIARLQGRQVQGIVEQTRQMLG